MSAPYYPKIELTESVTRFGAIESSHPTLYKTKINDKSIYEIDTLEILKEIWGESILTSRGYTYKIVSGSCSDDEYRALLRSYYRKFSAFSNYVNSVFLFGDKSIPKIVRLVKPARELIDSYTERVIAQTQSCGAKFLMRSHDYVYCALPEYSCSVLPMNGVVHVC